MVAPDRTNSACPAFEDEAEGRRGSGGAAPRSGVEGTAAPGWGFPRPSEAESGGGTGRGGGGEETLVTPTAHTFNSGWNDNGSTASLVTALMLRYSPNRSFQWNGANRHPGRTRSVTTAGNTARPRRE